MEENSKRNVSVLLVEDNPGDIRLTKEALKEVNVNIDLNIAVDGEEALDYLHKRNQYADAVRPKFILLDLNLPKKNGIEVLEEIKSDDNLKTIPVIILTTSDADHDVTKSYKTHANSFIIKPVDFDEFTRVIQLVEKFWFNVVKLPLD